MTTEHDIDIGDLCFTARALAQTHPMSDLAHRYRQQCFEAERARQPVTELADWAATALLVGYCLRRAEEQAVGASPVAEPIGVDIAERARAVGESLRVGTAEAVTLLAAPITIAALDAVIATELDKRREHLREQLDDEAWSELEDYISWWTVHGYAVRTAESPRP